MNTKELRQLPNDYGKCTLLGINAIDKWCHIVTETSAPQIHSFVQRASKMLGIKKPPRIVLYDSNTNVGNAGFHVFNDTIYLDLSYIRFFDNNQNIIHNTIGHELGHKTQTRRNFLSVALTILGSMAIEYANPSRIPFSLPVFVACLAALSFYSELDADYKGALVTSPQDAIAHMEKLNAAFPRSSTASWLREIIDDRGHLHPSEEFRIHAIKKRFNLEK